jgi:hypothetical protein
MGVRLRRRPRRTARTARGLTRSSGISVEAVDDNATTHLDAALVFVAPSPYDAVCTGRARTSII